MKNLWMIAPTAATMLASGAYAQDTTASETKAPQTRVVAVHIKDRSPGNVLSIDPRSATQTLVTRGLDALMTELEATASANVLYDAHEPAGVASWELREERTSTSRTTTSTDAAGQRASLATSDTSGFVMARQEPAEEGLRKLSLSLEAPQQPSAGSAHPSVERLNFTATIDPATHRAALVHSVHGHGTGHDALLTAVGPASAAPTDQTTAPGKLLQITVLRIPTPQKDAVMSELMTLPPDTQLSDLNLVAARTEGHLIYHTVMPAALDHSLRFTTSTDTSEQQAEQVGGSAIQSQFDLRDSLSVLIRPDEGTLKYFEVKLQDAERSETLLASRSAEWKGTRTFADQPFVSAVDVTRDTVNSSPNAPPPDAQSYVLVMRAN